MAVFDFNSSLVPNLIGLDVDKCCFRTTCQWYYDKCLKLQLKKLYLAVFLGSHLIQFRSVTHCHVRDLTFIFERGEMSGPNTVKSQNGKKRS